MILEHAEVFLPSSENIPKKLKALKRHSVGLNLRCDLVI